MVTPGTKVRHELIFCFCCFIGGIPGPRECASGTAGVLSPNQLFECDRNIELLHVKSLR